MAAWSGYSSNHKPDSTIGLVKGGYLTVYKRSSPINCETSSSVFSWRYKTSRDGFLRGTTSHAATAAWIKQKIPLTKQTRRFPSRYLPLNNRLRARWSTVCHLCFLFVLLLSRLRELTLDGSSCSLSSKQYGSWATAEFTYAVWPGAIVHECSDTSTVPNMCFLSLEPGEEGMCWDYWLHLWELQGAEIHWRLSSHEQWLS